MKRKVSIWTDCLPVSLDVFEVADFLRDFGFDARIRGGLFEAKGGNNTLAAFLAGIRIQDFETPLDRPATPSRENVDEEVSDLRTGETIAEHAYDGFWFQRKLHTEIASFHSPDTLANLVLTGRLVCTYGRKRYHARVVLMGAMRSAVQIVSTAGVVEGPARPPEYYWAKGRIFQRGLTGDELRDALSVLDDTFKGRFVEQSDPLMGRIVSAYCLQPLLYVIGGRVFCEDPGCCLFNSHRQSEVLKAQAQGAVCEQCSGMLSGAGG